MEGGKVGQSSLNNELFSKTAGKNQQISWPSQGTKLDVIPFIVTNHMYLTDFQQVIQIVIILFIVPNHKLPCWVSTAC